MSVEWFGKSPKGVVTIYNSYITLNTVASDNFKNTYGTIIGYNSNDKTLLIKAVSKEEVSMGLYNKIEIHSISIKPSYGRISGRSIINKLCEYYPLDFEEKNLKKFECEWINEEKTLKVFLERRLS